MSNKYYIVTYDNYPRRLYKFKKTAEKYIEDNPDNLVKSELDIVELELNE